MSEGKDPGIKLFGRTIQLPGIPPPPPPPPPDTADSSCTDAPPPKSEDRSSYSSSSSSEEDESNSKHVVAGNEQRSDKNTREEKCIREEENRAQSLMSEELTDPSATSVLNDNSKTPSVDSESATAKKTKTEEEQSERSNSQDKTLKKPDKILPCPRCNSMDTKFCYYNNYNVNQPRHFCKNCQRYWTAGGNMRNVPVGAGRRKNKASASHYHQITVTEALQNTRADLPNGLHHPILKANGTVLTFGSDSTPLCESMTTVLKIAEKTRQNGLNKPEVSGNGDDHSSGSSVTDGQNCQNGFPPQVPCFPGAPWPFPWAPQMGPAFVPPGYPMPFYPAPPYWGCAVPGPWNVPWVTPPTNYHAAPSSPTLGKHARDDENMAKSSEFGEDQTQKENEPEKSLWIPKTLRIDDPGEAAKSSIWATLGIKNDRSDAVNGGGIFKAFRSRREGKNHISEASPVLQANPAALSRSANFQESS